jgi:hypothetical protein
MNLLLLWQFKALRLLLKLTIVEIWEVYTVKTIDENNRKPTGNDATIIRDVGYPNTVLKKGHRRCKG